MLDGTLNVTLLNGYVPPAWTSFRLLSSPAASGQFAATNLPTLPAYLGWSLNSDTNGLTLTSLVTGTNHAPSFTTNPVVKPSVVEDYPYAGTLAGSATDPDAGDLLSFTKVSGPAWLAVAPNGALSGYSAASDIGTNLFTVRATDLGGLTANATLQIAVLPSGGSNGVWTSADGGSWTNSANWSGGIVANGASKTADFSTLNLSATATVTLNANRTIGQLYFADTIPNYDWVLAPGSPAGTLTLASTRGAPIVNVSNRTATFSAVLACTNGFIKTGAGTLALTAANTFSGPATISAGTLIVSNASGLGSGKVTLGNTNTGAADTASLFDVTGASFSGTTNDITVAANTTGKVTIGSTRVSGTGNYARYTGNLTAGRDVIFQGAGGDFYLGNYSPLTGSMTGTAAMTFIGGQRFIVDSSGYRSVVGDAFVTNNSLLQLYQDLFGATRNVDVASGAGLAVNVAAFLGRLTGGGAAGQIGGAASTLTVGNGDVSATFTGRIGAATGIGRQNLGDSLSLVKTGAGTFALGGSNTYSGTTTVNGGTLLVNGSLNGAGAVTVSAGTLGGSGTIKSPVTVQSPGTLAPGASPSVLTISNTLSLAGTAVFDLEAAARTNDRVRGLSTVTYGGALVLNNLSGMLAPDDTFKLFDASNYAGAFARLTSITPNQVVTWDQSGLLSNGSVKVASAISTLPPQLGFSFSSGTNLLLSWPPDHTAWHLQAQTNAPGMGLGANWFGVAGSTATNLLNIPVDPANGSVFYRLAYP